MQSVVRIDYNQFDAFRIFSFPSVYINDIKYKVTIKLILTNIILYYLREHGTINISEMLFVLL